MENISSLKQAKSVHPKAKVYETAIWTRKALLSGIDEVGRGCLAGPVVACAVILHPHVDHPLLKDSKILTENQRAQAAKWIKLNAWYGFGIFDHTFIDKHNIYQATLVAMKRAYYSLVSNPQLPQLPSHVLVDAMPLLLDPYASHVPEILNFTQGESKSISIAAASILAKVMRDALMVRLAKNFPGYHFALNKGYAARIHRAHLETQGTSLIHRESFITKLKKGNSNEDGKKQTSLFC